MTKRSTKPALLERPFANKVVGHGIERADQLLASPDNWRIHPEMQQQALAGAIDTVGFIRSVTVNKTTGHVVDGHLRVALALRSGVEELPVEYVELTEAEEAQALISLDPIAAFAVADRQKLDDLLRQVQSDDERVQALMAEIAYKEGITPPDFQPVGIDEQPRLDQKKPVICPECGAEFTPK